LRYRNIVYLSALALALPVPVSAQQAGDLATKTTPFALSVSTGVDYSTGDYGFAGDTKIFVAPVSVRATTGAFAFSAAVPYLRITGSSGVVVGPEGQPLPGLGTAGGDRKGIGDLSFGGTYTLRPETLDGLEVGLGARVKLPTSADHLRLGTGKTDYKLSADLSYALADFIPFLTLGYRVMGDPQGVVLRDGPTASLGVSAPLGKSVLILSYDYARAVSALAEDSQEIFGGVSVPVTDSVSITGYGIAGLSDGSPDVGLGILLTMKIF
jgi:hypothetical protein